jgi:transcriptional regulator with XRE-family HTH domain
MKMARMKRGITQALLSEKIEVSPSYVSYIENGTKSMSLETFVLIANELNVSADELLHDNLVNTVRVSNHRFAAELADCSEYELRILFDVLKAAKKALRDHRFLYKRH